MSVRDMLGCGLEISVVPVSSPVLQRLQSPDLDGQMEEKVGLQRM